MSVIQDLAVALLFVGIAIGALTIEIIHSWVKRKQDEQLAYRLSAEEYRIVRGILR